jgi:hypothetical protein
MFGINPGLDAVWAGIWLFVILVLYFYLSHIEEDGGPSRLARWHAAFVMSRDRRAAAAKKSNEEPAFPQSTTTPQSATTALQSDATIANALLRGQARALAAMVKAGKIGETEGIKLVFGVSPSSTNARYQAARSALKAELDRLTNPYPQRTEEQKRAREALGIGKS